MLNFTTIDGIRAEVWRLCATLKPERPLPLVTVVRGRNREVQATGWHQHNNAIGVARIHLSVPSHASAAQAATIICHEVAHWTRGAWACVNPHGLSWRTDFMKVAALYGVVLGPDGARVDEAATAALRASRGTDPAAETRERAGEV